MHFNVQTLQCEDGESTRQLAHKQKFHKSLSAKHLSDEHETASALREKREDDINETNIKQKLHKKILIRSVLFLFFKLSKLFDFNIKHTHTQRQAEG